MKTTSILACALGLISLGIWNSCSQPSGSLSTDSVRDALSAKSVAVTPCAPAWLLGENDVHRLSAADLKTLRLLTYKAKSREVPDSFYRDAEAGNRHDDSHRLFYLYASNEQSLGARVVKDKIFLDDMEISEESARALYKLLIPYVNLLPFQVGQ